MTQTLAVLGQGLKVLGTAVLGLFSLLDTRNRIAVKDTEAFFENIERDIRGNR